MESPQQTTKKELSVSMVKATLWSLVFGLPPAFFLLYLYDRRWGADLKINLLYFIPILAAITIFGSIPRELIHGFTWTYFGHKPLNAIKFGFQWKTLPPYAHCHEPMDVNAYRIGGLCHCWRWASCKR